VEATARGVATLSNGQPRAPPLFASSGPPGVL